MNRITALLASLQFDDPSSNGHALDVDCAGELLAYKKLVPE